MIAGDGAGGGWSAPAAPGPNPGAIGKGSPAGTLFPQTRRNCELLMNEASWKLELIRVAA